MYVSLFWLMGFSLAWANQTGDRNMLERLGDYAIYAEDKIDTIDSLTPVILFDEDFDEDDEEERDDLLDDSCQATLVLTPLTTPEMTPSS